MTVTPYLFFKGNCAEAIAFYQAAAGAVLDYAIKYGESPAAAQLPAAMHNQIINAAFRIGETVVMASDCPPDKWGGAPTGFSLCISASSNAEAEQLYGALAQGGTIVMAMGETYFAHRFGQFVDKFGVPWMIIFEKTPG